MPASREETSLCCCEYVNTQGERAHILECCCNCEEVDEAADRLVSCRSVPSHLVDRVLDVLVDRCRVPFFRGAQKIRLDITIPILSIPLLLYTATYGPVHTAISFLLMPIVILVSHRLLRRTMKHQRNNFFFAWGCMSVMCGVVVFETAVVSFREVYLWENLLLISSLALCVYALVLCRKDPGYVRRTKRLRMDGAGGSYLRHSRRRDASRGSDEELHILDVNDRLDDDENCVPDYSVTWVDSRPFSDGKLVTWCQSCQVDRQPRSGHCTVCNWCVEGRDHHCVWINSCVGARNHRSFIVAWSLIVFVGFYGCQLSLTSVCTPEMYLDWFLLPNDCRFVYGDIYNSLSFVTSLYSWISSCILLSGLIYQFILIGQNITMQEFYRAGKRGMLKYGLIAQRNLNNRGLLRNFRDFWTDHRKQTYQTSMSV